MRPLGVSSVHSLDSYLGKLQSAVLMTQQARALAPGVAPGNHIV